MKKEGVANNYGNLGNVYQARGDLDRAEAMYVKALDLFERLGSSTSLIVKQWLLDLRK